MDYSITANLILVTETCCNCSIVFAMPKQLQSRRLSDGGSFYCPNGHGQHYTETAVQKLQKQLNRANEDSQYWRQRQLDTERSLNAQKGIATKLKKRIANGVCPCCNRTFTNVARHIKTKHPELLKEQK